MIYQNIMQMIGKTPLLQLNNMKKKYEYSATLFAKLERQNPAGSSKDRVALFMIEDAEKRGLLTKNSIIVESTSGNTGIGLASICASKGYRLILTMPETMSIERRKLLSAYGAEIVLTEGAKGMQGAVDKANELVANDKNCIILGQFDNPANPLAHYMTTAQEIWDDLQGKIDVFVATIGTGGTISGVAKFLKEKNPNIHIVGVEPDTSPLITKGYAGAHKIQGIGANFLPKTLDLTNIDEVLTTNHIPSFEKSKSLARTEGILVGISSGACLEIAISLAKSDKWAGKNIVALLADSGERYMSTPMFED